MPRTRSVSHVRDASTILFVYRRINPSTGLYFDGTKITACTITIHDAESTSTPLLPAAAMTFDAALRGYKFTWTYGAALDGARVLSVLFQPVRDSSVAAALAPEEAMEIDLADALEIEPGISPRAADRILLASQAGKLSGAGTNTIRIRDVADTKDVIVGTVDGAGNRTATAVDGS